MFLSHSKICDFLNDTVWNRLKESNGLVSYIALASADVNYLPHLKDLVEVSLQGFHTICVP